MQRKTFGKCSSRGKILSSLLFKNRFLATAGTMDYGGDRGRILETTYAGVTGNRNSREMLEVDLVLSAGMKE